MNDYTTFLIPKTGLLTGAASAFNIAGNFYRYNGSSSAAAADRRALKSDFRAAGNDLRKALKEARDPKDSRQLKLNLGKQNAS